jgi:hypothetical protein
MAEGIVQLGVGDAEGSCEGQRVGDVGYLIERVAIGAEGQADTVFDGAPNESLVGPVAIRDLEGDACYGKRANGALFSLLGPELLQRIPAEREGEERRVGENVDWHLPCEALEILDVRVHVCVGRDVRESTRERVDERAVGQPDGVE